MAEKKVTFEDSIGRLEEIVRILEKGEGTLDEAMKLFEEGSKLAQRCSTMLARAEQKVTRLVAGGEEIPFEAGE